MTHDEIVAGGGRGETQKLRRRDGIQRKEGEKKILATWFATRSDDDDDDDVGKEVDERGAGKVPPRELAGLSLVRIPFSGDF